MKTIRLVVLAFFALLISTTELNAQCSILATAQSQSLTLTGGSGYTKFSVAYNPILAVYYTTNGNYTQTHSGSTGSNLNSYYNTNTRALWWNGRTSQLEGNGYGFTGTFKYALNTAGRPTSRSAIHTGYNQPNYNSQGSFDSTANELLYFNPTSIYRYSRTTGKYVGVRSVTGLPVSTSYITTYSSIYTGCAGKEIGLYDRVNRRLYFVNKSTGVYVGYSQLPTTAPTPYSYGVAYANGFLWLSNGSSWFSYKVLHSGLQTSTIAGPFCDSSKVSINFSINTKTFTAGNIFTAQLSNANGSFSSPVTLDTVTATTAQTMTGYIPKNTPFGSGYRIRVIASSPSTTGIDNGTNITINVPNPNLGNNVSKCPEDTATLTAASGGLSYNWSNGGTTQSIKVKNAGTYRVTVSNSVCSKSDTIVITNLSSPSPTLLDTVTKCAKSTTLSPGTFSSYKWSTGATTSSITAPASGVYYVTVTGSNTCKSKDTSFVNLLIKEINGGKDTSICAGDTIQLSSGTGCNFRMNSMLKTGAKNVYSYSAAGDDRGGIAVTPNYIYYTGDSYTARYDVNLTTYSRLTRQDGIFSDLSTGQVYTFWNSSYTSFYNNYTILGSINSIRAMNSSLAYTGSTITLSQSINGTNGSAVFAGSGYVILWSGFDRNFYKIDLPSGNVTNLGNYNLGLVRYNSENWASWGIAECNGSGGHNVLLRAASNTTLGTVAGEISRFNISTKTFSTASSFGNTNLGDISCITYSPWNSRWYYQSEYSTIFGTYSENLGYATATHTGGGNGKNSINTFSWSTGAKTATIDVSPSTTTNYWVKLSHGTVSCADTIAVKVNATPTISLTDSVLTCNVDSSLLTAASGFSSYKWNTGQTSRSIYVKGTGIYQLTVTDTKGCTGDDSSYVNILDARMNQVDTTLCNADSLDLIVNNVCGSRITSLLETNVVRGNGNYAGDDRGGIAVTPNYVYDNGDNYCVRYNTTLNSYTRFGIRDGIFSDLSTGQLYTFWSSTYNNFGSSTSYTQNITSIRKMDASLNYGSTITLSQTINAGTGSLVAAGTGYVILYSARTYKFYKITLSSGKVEVLGTQNITNFIYRSENWAAWGVAECGNGGHSLVLRSRLSGFPISRYDISTNTWTTVATRTYGYGGIASMTYSPWNGKWYFLHEGSITGFGIYGENVVGADATAIGFNSSGSTFGNGKFLWSTSDTVGSIKVSPNVSTSYSVTVSNNSSSCSDTVAITVIQSPSVTDSVTNLKCFADTNGKASVSVSGGTTPYTYKWSTGGKSSAISKLTAGFYAYTVTGNNACRIVDSVEVRQPTQISAVATILNSATCYTSSDGKAKILASGGTPPYAYSWPSGTKDTLDTMVIAGLNIVTVTDSNSCVFLDSVTMTSPIQIGKPGPITSTKTFFCPGDSGTLIAANPGSVNSTYSKTSATLQTATSSSLTVTFSNVPKKITSGGKLTVYFKGDLDRSDEYLQIFNETNGYMGYTRYRYASCNVYNSMVINVSQAQLISWAADGKISFRTTPSYYVNGCTYDYSVYMVLSYDYLGGKTYWFSNKSTDTTTALGSGANLKINPLVSTTYFASKFNNSCNGEFDSIKVIVAPKPTVNYTVTPSKFCSGDTASVVASGAVSYTWPTSTTMSGSGSTATVYPATSTDYPVTVTDYFSCKHTDTMSITVQPNPSANLLSSTNVSCSSQNNGTAAVYGTGGTAPFTYKWSNGLTGPFQLALGSGSYIVTVTDKNSCEDTITVNIGGPKAMKFNETVVNIKCKGQGSGSISLSPTGGATPYTYSWSSGASTSSISNLASGNYSVTITDNSSCSHDTTFTITEPLKLVASILSKSNETCPGVSNGAISAGATGGTSPYSYSWNNSSTSSSLSGINGGVYTVTVTDKNSCTSTISDTVKTLPSTLSINVNSTTNILCFNGKTGGATVSGVSGSTPYVYKWSNGSTSSSISNVGSGLYVVTVTDNNSCQHVDSVTLTQNSKLVSSATIAKHVSCNGLKDGSASIQVSGGTPGYSFSWPDGKTSSSNTTLAAATHLVSVTDANSCADTVSITITEPNAIQLAATVSNLSCNQSANGSISVTSSGGSPSYSYLWTTGATSSSISSLVAGSYSVTVTDGKSCTVDSSFTLTEPAKLAIKVDSVTDVKCKGSSNGGVYTSTTGGTSPYSYLWSNGSSTRNLSGVVAANYSVTITDSKGCTDTVSANVNQPSNLLVASILDSTNNPCFGGLVGMAKVTVNGGGKPYSYSWSNGGTDSSITNQKAGLYSVVVTDSYGCQVSDSVVLSQGDSIKLSVQSKKDISCNGLSDGKATIAVVGGTPTFGYSWSNGSNTNSINNVVAGNYKMVLTDANGCKDSISVSLTEPNVFVASIANRRNIACKDDSTGFVVVNTTGGTSPLTYSWNTGASVDSVFKLTSGSYSVTVTDANGCMDTSAAVLTQPSTRLVAYISDSTNISCFGGSNGQVKSKVSGGGTPYTYLWSNGGVDSTITNQTFGKYSLVVTDSYGCSISDSVTLTQPNVLALSVSKKKNVSCNGHSDGSARILVTGGTSAYTYSWSNSSSTDSISNVSAGNYKLNLTDVNGCKDSITVAITQPAVLNASVSSLKNISCFGDSTGYVAVNVGGGTTPYQYSWNTGASNDSISKLKIGSYKVIVTDKNGCLDSITSVLTQPSKLTLSAVSTNNLCFGESIGSAKVSVSGGVTPYSYAWSGGGSADSVKNLASGKYTVTVTDSLNCQDTISRVISEPTKLTSSVTSKVNPLCNGANTGLINTLVSGGVTSYSYKWSNGDTTANTDTLTAGTYTLTITDGNSCKDTLSVVLTEPTALKASLVTKDALCNKDTNGSINATITGGLTPYKYAWSNSRTVANNSNLAAGIYSLTVTDTNKCEIIVVDTVKEPKLLVASVLSSADINCAGDTTGKATVAGTGGTTPYTYSWSGGQSVFNPTNLAIGLNVVTIEDKNGCKDTASVTLKQLSTLKLSLVSTAGILCNGDTTANITVSATGGKGIPKYSWSVAGSDSLLNNIGAGNYTAFVADSVGCTDSLNVAITQPSAISVAKTNVQNVLCFGDSIGSVTLQSTGGVGSLKYLWSTGDTTSMVSKLKASTYMVTVTDSNKCSKSIQVLITEPSKLENTGFTITSPNCYYDTTGVAVSNFKGGTKPYTYNWSNGSTQNFASALSSGLYKLTVTDSNGCIAIDTAKIPASNPRTFSGLPRDSTTCGDSIELKTTASFISYSWSTGSTSPSLVVTKTDTITFTGLDANNCFTYDTVRVTVLNGAVVNLGNDISNVCEGTVHSIDAGNGFVKYKWSNGDTTSKISVSTSGTYFVTATDSKNCVTTDDVLVSMFPLPVVSLGNDTLVCEELWAGIMDLNAGSGFSGYSWSNGKTTGIISITSGGTYSVTVTDNNGCEGKDTIEVTIDKCNGINTVVSNLTVNVYPNPARRLVNVELNGIDEQLKGIELLSTNGQVIKSIALENVFESKLNTHFDLDDISPSVYYIRITSESRTIIKSLVVY